MGYDVHITRRRYWTDRVPNDITYEEWKWLAESDPEFKKCGETTWNLGQALIEDDSEPEPRGGVEAVYNSYGLAGHPDFPSFDYYDGKIDVRGPDEVTFRKMFEVAAKLGAVIQGDEGEYYRLGEHGVEQTWDYPKPGSS